jgi:hypothetical protein
MGIQLQYLPWLKAKPEAPTLDAWLTHVLWSEKRYAAALAAVCQWRVIGVFQK